MANKDDLDIYDLAFNNDATNNQVRQTIEERDKQIRKEQRRRKLKKILKVLYRIVKELLSFIGGVWIIIQLLKFFGVI